MTADPRSVEQQAHDLGRWDKFSREELVVLYAVLCDIHYPRGQGAEIAYALGDEVALALAVHAEIEGGTDPVGAL